MLEYIMARIVATSTLNDSLLSKQLTVEKDGLSTGHFLNLTCGHNNQYSVEERKELEKLLSLACEEDSQFLV
jgi:hypothetical protein